MNPLCYCPLARGKAYLTSDFRVIFSSLSSKTKYAEVLTLIANCVEIEILMTRYDYAAVIIIQFGIFQS